MRKKMRIAALFMVCLLMLSQILTGCNSKPAEQQATESPTSAPTVSGPEPLYPIKGNVTLKVWMPIPSIASKHIQTYAESDAFIRAMEDTGVKLEFIHPANGQETEAFNLMVASQDLPDIMFDGARRYKGGVVQAARDGIIADLTELIPDYAPDYYKLLQENHEFYRETTEDGKTYAFYIYKDVPASVEGEHTRSQFRLDWLEEFNMDIPKTFEQYEAYFKKVLEAKPGVAPFVLAKSGVEKQILQTFNLSTGYFLKDGKVTWYAANPEFKDYLTLLNKWYKEGYISKDFTNAEPIDLFLAGKAACFIGTSINTFQGAKELGMKVTTGPYVRQYEGQKLHAAYTLFPKNSVNYEGTVAESSQHKAEAIKFINYGYSKDGYKTYQYGPEGIAWTMGPDGRPQYTDYVLNNPKYSITDLDYIIRIHTGMPRLRDSDRYSIPSNIKDPETLNYRLKWADDSDADASAILPSMQLTTEANTERTNIMNDINTYTSEMTLKFITGAEPMTNFDKFLETIKSMGVDRAIEITQKAYNDHMSK